MSSLRASIFRAVSGAYVNRADIEDIDFHKVRRFWGRAGKYLLTAFGVRVEPVEINGLYAEWLVPGDEQDGKVLLYLHGGGYVVGCCNMYRQLVSHISRAGRIRTLLPEYRLAPEHKYPAAIDDAVTTYRTLLSMGIAAKDIVVAGDSAGGGLAVATLLALRDAGDEMPAAAVLLSPFLDVTGSGETMTTRAHRDPWFQPGDLSVIADHYCEAHQRRFPDVSPVFANVEGLPPMLIQVGDDEILLSDSERFADLLVAAGITVDLDVWPEMWHVFQIFLGRMPESRQAIDKMGEFIRSV